MPDFKPSPLSKARQRCFMILKTLENFFVSFSTIC
jgi:hypothetical protein